ncbi:MAG: hypothetical protein M1536_08875 [Firmicutes bacterium]|nr:hypothetical protein [Bacillota bacterium]
MNKKTLSILMVLFFLFSLPFFVYAKSTGYSDPRTCRTHLKNIEVALELWAIDHNGKYPSVKEYYSPAFINYLSQAMPRADKNTLSQVLLCPASKKKYKYEVSKNFLRCRLACPNPSLHGMTKLEFVPNQVTVNEESAKTLAGFTVPKEEMEEITAVIKDLYDAYTKKDLERVLDIEEDAIRKSAERMSAEKQIKPEDVWNAFKEGTEEMLNNKDFKMKPLNLKNLGKLIFILNFVKIGDVIQVTSDDLIIESGTVQLGNQIARIKISNFYFRKIKDTWKIIQMGF